MTCDHNANAIAGAMAFEKVVPPPSDVSSISALTKASNTLGREAKGSDRREPPTLGEPRTWADFWAIVEATPAWEPGQAKPADESGEELPLVTLPCETTTITKAAGNLGQLMAATGKFYMRGGVPVRLVEANSDAGIKLEPIRPAAACSDFETVAKLQKERMTDDGPEAKPAICGKSTAEQILESLAFQQGLPPVVVVSRCPLLVERENGELATVVGYDRESGVWTMGEQPIDMALAEAGSLLHEAICDDDFVSPGDKSRALAAFITPAMVLGGLLGARAPMDTAEADASQAGKGYRLKRVAAVYRTEWKAVTQKDRSEGGVGSMQEKFDKYLIDGENFISFDNQRGKADHQFLESFMTEDNYVARIPFMRPVTINPKLVCLGYTSNKTEATEDLANRGAIVRQRKRPQGYQFRQYPEGRILDHIRANQPRYLGAVFAIVREWHRLGKPALPEHEVEHDFKRWGAVLGWIVQNLLGGEPMLAGHRDVQRRIASDVLGWARQVSLAVESAGLLNTDLKPGELLNVAIDAEVATAGIDADAARADDDRFKSAALVFGRKLAKCIGEVDGIEISQIKKPDENFREKNFYRFTRIDTPQCAPNTPLIEPPIKTRNPPIPPIDSIGPYSASSLETSGGGGESVCDSALTNKEPIGGTRGIGGCVHSAHVDRSQGINRGGMMRCPICGEDCGWA